MSLRLRLGLATAVVVGVLVAATGLLYLLQLQASLEASYDDSLVARAAILSRQYLAEEGDFRRAAQFEQSLQVLGPHNDVVVSSGPSRSSFLSQTQRQEVLTRARAGAPPLSFTSGPRHDRTRYVAVALPTTGDLVLVVGIETEVADAATANVARGLIIVGIPAIIGSGVAAWWLAGAALRPVERMRRQTAMMSVHEDTGGVLAVPPTGDELAALARTMNHLLARLRAAVDHERGFVADAGHELRTPLATLRAELELAGRPGRSADELQAAIYAAIEETDRLIRLSEDLLLLARLNVERGTLDLTLVELGRLAAAAARAAMLRHDGLGITISVTRQSAAWVKGNGDRLRQALDNLLNNAVQHSPVDGSVTVTVRKEGAAVSLSVSDEGPGFTDAFLPHAFERFRRGSSVRSRTDGGAGLGLAVVDAIARAHDGSVCARNNTSHGATVTMTFPAAPQQRHGVSVDAQRIERNEAHES